METRPLGQTGLKVTALGFGAMHLNDQRVSEADAGRLLNQVLDLGVNLIDTARGYGLSEERIGPICRTGVRSLSAFVPAAHTRTR